MADYEYVYYDMQTDKAYRANKSQIANDNVPEFPYKSQRSIYFQLLNSYTTALSDTYTRLSAVSVTASAAIDNDATHYEDANPNAAITLGAPIATVAIKNLSATPRINGRLKFTNGSGNTETVNYNNWSLNASVYTFTLADSSYVTASWTPTYGYLTTDTCRYLQIPITKDASVDCTNKDTGLFVIDLDCNKAIFQELIEWSEEIESCKLEIQILDGTGYPVIAKRIPVKLTYLLDDDSGNVGGAPTTDYYTSTQCDALFYKIAGGTQSTLTDNATTSINVFDKTTHRAATVDFFIIGSAGIRVYSSHNLLFFGSTAYNGGEYHYGGTDWTSGLSITSDISGNNVRLNFVLASIGENLKLMYRVRKTTLET